jgi:hypothetical protein
MLREDIQPGYAPKEIKFLGYTTKNLHHSADATKAFQDTINRAQKGEIHNTKDILNALKATDAYMKINDMHLEQGKEPDENEVKQWIAAHRAARDLLNNIGEFSHHFDYWHIHEHELQDMLAKYNPETAGADMAEAKLPEVVMNPKSNYNAAKGILSYEDFMKLMKMNAMPAAPAGTHAQGETIKHPVESGTENIIAQKMSVFDGTVGNFGTTGSTMGAKDHNLRRRKVKYRID